MLDMRLKKRYTVLWILSLLLMLSGCKEVSQRASTVLINGIVFTATDNDDIAEAIAIKGEHILAVGSKNEISKHIGPKTQIVDLKGQFVCPGFNDAHVHFFHDRYQEAGLDLSGVTSIRELQRTARRKVRDLEPGAWLVGFGWDQNLFENKAWPDKNDLNAVDWTIPIFLRRICGHAALVNRSALRIAGITRETPNPQGGLIVKDPKTGEPTGILLDEAIDLVTQYIPGPTKDEIQISVLQGLKEAAGYGITSIQDCGQPDVYDVYKSLLQEGRLTCRVSVWFPLQEDLSEYRRYRNRFSDSMLRFGLLKGFTDGSLGARSARLLMPYADDPDNRGLKILEQDQLNLLVLNADREKFQIALHAIGDEANQMALDAYALAQRINGVRDSRHRIEHAQVLNPKEISRFHELGVVASMQPAHCIEDMGWVESRLGLQRSRYTYAWKSLLKSDARLAFGTDWPVAALNPLVGIYAAVTRRDTTGVPASGWYPQERLTVAEAIRAYTAGSAYAEFADDVKGTIEAGKLADLVVLDRNLLEISPGEILKTRVVYTILGGKTVYSSEEAIAPVKSESTVR